MSLLSIKNVFKIIGLTAIIMILGLSLWTERVSAVGISHAVASPWIPYTLYEVFHEHKDKHVKGEEEEQGWKGSIHSIDGTKDLAYKDEMFTAKLGEIFMYEGDNTYLNEVEGSLHLRVSDPEVISLSQKDSTVEKEISGAKNTEIPVQLYPRSEGAAVLYVDKKRDGVVTTLGKVEVEVTK